MFLKIYPWLKLFPNDEPAGRESAFLEDFLEAFAPDSGDATAACISSEMRNPRLYFRNKLLQRLVHLPADEETIADSHAWKFVKLSDDGAMCARPELVAILGKPLLDILDQMRSTAPINCLLYPWLAAQPFSGVIHRAVVLSVPELSTVTLKREPFGDVRMSFAFLISTFWPIF